MYPVIESPVLNAESGYLPEDFQLFINPPSGGDILYTFDGSDPGFAFGDMSGSVIIYDGNALPLLTDTIYIRARVKGDGLWSKLVSRQFIIGEDPATGIHNLTEIGDIYFQSYPNPAKDYVQIRFSLPHLSSVSLNIYNLMGEHIVTLNNGTMQAGKYSVNWNTVHIPPGNYICFLDNLSEAKRYRIRIVIE